MTFLAESAVIEVGDMTLRRMALWRGRGRLAGRGLKGPFVGLGFSHNLDVTLQSQTCGRAAVWAAANTTHNLYHWGTSHQAVSVAVQGGGGNSIVLANHEGSGAGYSDTYTGVAQGTPYYLTVDRPEAAVVRLRIGIRDAFAFPANQGQPIPLERAKHP